MCAQYFGNEHIKALAEGFQLFTEDGTTLECIRDHIRHQLHAKNPRNFPMGKVGASVADLAHEILRTKKTIALSQHICSNCDFEGPEEDNRLGYVLSAGQSVVNSTPQWINALEYPSERSCPECLCEMVKVVYHKAAPKLIIMDYCGRNIKTSQKLMIETNEDRVLLDLKGLVYLGDGHFTSHTYLQMEMCGIMMVLQLARDVRLMAVSRP